MHDEANTPAARSQERPTAARPAGSLRSSQRRNPALAKATVLDLVTELRSRLPGIELSPERKGVGRLGSEIALQLHRDPADRYSPASSMRLARVLLLHPDFRLNDLDGATCVDVGCGGMSPLAPLFVFVLAGAARGIGVDLDTIDSPPLAVRALYDCMAAVWSRSTEPVIPIDTEALLRRTAGFDFRKLAAGDPAGIDTARLEFRSARIEAAGLEDESADVVTSVSFLEHVADPGQVIAELARISRPGALGVHTIDGVDHRSYGRPEVGYLDFLEIESDQPVVHNCNRIRPLEFRAMFEAHGFEVRHLGTSLRIPVDDDARARMAEPFRSLPTEVLEFGQATYHVRRAARQW